MLFTELIFNLKPHTVNKQLKTSKRRKLSARETFFCMYDNDRANELPLFLYILNSEIYIYLLKDDIF